MSLLVVEKLEKSFGGVRALDGVSFALEPGERLALIGPNGAGKTTCFNLVNGQLRPDAGRIAFDGRAIQGLPPRELCRRGIGRTFQVAATFSSMTLLENVQVVGGDIGLLEQVGLSSQSGRWSAELAYGDLKRLELAVALASNPRLLLMDEPTAGMAEEERRALMDLVRQVSKEKGIAVLFTEHDVDVVFTYADRVLVLSDGKLIAQGAPADIRADPLVRRVYLGEDAHA
jgi:ABC-type branched-subunit amino acid transport system ATPase component